MIILYLSISFIIELPPIEKNSIPKSSSLGYTLAVNVLYPSLINTSTLLISKKICNLKQPSIKLISVLLVEIFSSSPLITIPDLLLSIITVDDSLS